MAIIGATRVKKGLAVIGRFEKEMRVGRKFYTVLAMEKVLQLEP